MNTAVVVDNYIRNWKDSGITDADLVVAIAKACMGWPYVFGARGQQCTPSNRRARIRSDHPTIYTKCQVLTGSQTSCTGCKYHPGGATRFFDCRGFTYWVFLQAGYRINGAGATSQYNDDNNWSEKGLIANMPRDVVCCVFKDVKGTKEHTGIHIGNGEIIHCSNGVQSGKITDKGWTHYALVKGFDGKLKEGGTPVVMPGVSERTAFPTLRKGSAGDDVVTLQKMLMALGYDCAKTGADGKFGVNTEAAVKRFQQEHHLAVDGIVGAATWGCLNQLKPAASEEVSSTPASAEPAADQKDTPVPASASKEAPVPASTTPDGSLYTAHIPNQTFYQAEAVVQQYLSSGAYMTRQKGGDD